MPLIAIRLQPMARKSLGGIQTDLELPRAAAATAASRSRGLYAVGEAAGFGGGGVHGKRSLEGTFLGGCVLHRARGRQGHRRHGPVGSGRRRDLVRTRGARRPHDPGGLMSQTVAEFMLDRLQAQWGVGRIYGYPGDGISGFMAAFRELDGSPEFVQVRHEVIASFAACAHAKFTGELGVCVATSGPGAVQLLNGLYDAKLDHQPVLALVGQQQRVSLGAEWLQEVDLQALFKDVAGEFVHTCMAPEQARHLVDRAVRTALSSRTVACVIVPIDVQHAGAESPIAGTVRCSPRRRSVRRAQCPTRSSCAGRQTC